MMWLALAVWLVFVVASAVMAAGMFRDAYRDAQHELVVDALWDDEVAGVRSPRCTCRRHAVCAWCLGLLRGQS